MKYAILALLFLAAISGNKAQADEYPTSVQNIKGLTAVLEYCQSEGINPASITFLDYHYYDGDLSRLEYSVTSYERNTKCVRMIPIDYPWPDSPEAEATVNLDEAIEAECE